MRQTKCINTLKKAAKELNIKVSKAKDLYKLEYQHLPIYVLEREAEGTFALISHVYDTAEGTLGEEQLKTALEVVESFHGNYSGDWNDGLPYFVSPEYSVEEGAQRTGEWLEGLLKEFWDAYMFLQANIHLMGDATIMKHL